MGRAGLLAVSHCLFSDFLAARWQFCENLQILPLGNVRLFRRIRRNDVCFLKMCVFRKHSVNVRVFRRKLMNYFGKSTNSTLGKRASFFAEFAEMTSPFWKRASVLQNLQKFVFFTEIEWFSEKNNDFPKKYRIPLQPCPPIWILLTFLISPSILKSWVTQLGMPK